jgi:hypothetical protein
MRTILWLNAPRHVKGLIFIPRPHTTLLHWTTTGLCHSCRRAPRAAFLWRRPASIGGRSKYASRLALVQMWARIAIYMLIYKIKCLQYVTVTRKLIGVSHGQKHVAVTHSSGAMPLQTMH